MMHFKCSNRFKIVIKFQCSVSMQHFNAVIRVFLSKNCVKYQIVSVVCAYDQGVSSLEHVH